MCIQHRFSAHLTQEDRFRIEALLSEGYAYRAIARTLGIDVSVISREIARNQSPDGRYCAAKAQKKSNERRINSKHNARKIENDETLAATIKVAMTGDDPVRGDWSPEVIANTILRNRVSHTTIYAWLKRSRRDLIHLLPQQGHRRIKYGAKTARAKARALTMPSIDLRPLAVESRCEIGHYEGDTMVVKNGRIHTLVERKSRFVIADLIRVLGVGLAMQVSESAISKLRPLPPTHRKTITYDRGSEFAWWDETEKHLPGMRVYFAHPYHPWERGTNERTNGLLRRYFPKRRYSGSITHDDVTVAVKRLNHRPRKILHWRTPCDVFGQCCSSRLN